MSLVRLTVEPSVIRWLRESADIDPVTAAQRIGVAPERISEWEQGETCPTIGQIRKMSEVYFRPLAVFFLPRPLEGEPSRDLPDFRRPEARSHTDSRALQKAVMRAFRQRDALRDIAEDLDMPEEETTARFSLVNEASSDNTGAHLRYVLGIDKLASSVVSRPDEFLRTLVRSSEDLGITVIQIQGVPVQEMRGFSLGQGSCPVVALNGADSPRGKAYTLLHELSHVGFRTDGLCDLQPSDRGDLERKCDRTAAAALMPAAAFMARAEEFGVTGATLTLDAARLLGNPFGASAESAVLRMVDLNKANWDDYRRLKPEFEQAYVDFRSASRSEPGDDLPIYYQLKRRDLGRRFIRQVVAAFDEDMLSARDLVQLLDVKFEKIPKLLGSGGELA